MSQYNLSQSAFYLLMKNEEKVVEQVSNSPARGNNQKSSKGVPALHAELERRLVKWLISKEKKGFLAGKTLIRAQALAIANELLVKDLKFTDGWFARFKARHGLLSLNSAGHLRKPPHFEDMF